METPEIPDFVVPFPPEVTPEEVINRRSRKKIMSKPPNRYVIYQIAYLKRLRDLMNISKIPIIKISPYISKSWNAERSEVREEYGRLSYQVGELLKVARKKSLVLIPEYPGPRPQAPPVEPEPSITSLSKQEIHYLLSLSYDHYKF